MKDNIPLIAHEKKQTYKSMFRISLMVFNIALSSFYFGYCIDYFSSI